MVVTDFCKIFLHCVITVMCTWNWYAIQEENFMCMCDSEAWSNEEINYCICTSNVTLCKKPERNCLFSFVIFVKPRCWMETVQYKPVTISAQHAWLQICHNKKKILKGLLCHESAQNCCWVTLILLTVFSWTCSYFFSISGLIIEIIILGKHFL